MPGQPQMSETCRFDQRGHGFAAVANRDVLRPGLALYETFDGGDAWSITMSGRKQINAIFGRGPRRVWALSRLPATAILEYDYGT